MIFFDGYLHIESKNTDRFLKFFHRHTL